MATPDASPNVLVANRRLASALLLCLGTLASLAIGWQAADARHARDEAELAAAAEVRVRILQRLLESQVQEVEALTRFADHLPGMDRKAFEAVVNGTSPAVTAISWIEIAPTDRRGAIEQRLSREYGRPVAIHPRPDDDRPQEHLYVLAYAEPEALVNSSLGIDLYARPARGRLIRDALDRRSLLARSGIPLLGTDREETALLLVSPLFDRSDPLKPRAAIQLSLRPADLLAEAARVHDSSAPINVGMVFRNAEGDAQALVEPDRHQRHMARLEFEFAGGRMSLKASPATELETSRLAPTPFALGMLLTLLAVGLMHSRLSQRSRAERLADERTQALRELNASLSEEAARVDLAQEGGGIWDWDVVNDSIHYSPQWKRALGYGEDELGDSYEAWQALVHPDDLPPAVAAIQAHFDQGTPYFECTYRMRCKDGSLRWFLDRGRTVAWQAPGKPARVVGKFTDVDAVKRLQDEASRLSAYLTALLDAATDVSIIATDPDGTIRLFSRGAEQLLDYRAQDMIGKETPELFHDLDEVREKGAELSAALGRPIEGFEVFVANARQGRPESGIWKYVRRNGQPRMVKLMVSAIEQSPGQLIGFLGVAVDMTEQLRNEAAFKRSDRLLRTLSDQVPGFIFQYQSTPGGHACFPFASSGIQQAFEVSADDVAITADPVIERIHPDDLAAYADSLRVSSELLTPWLHEFRALLPRRGQRWLRVEAQPERQLDGSMMWFGYITDISREKRLEEQLRDEARLDPLTGAFNRRHLQKQVNHELAMLEQTGKPLSLVMLDLDHFKSVNDTFGHDIGDEVLKATVDVLRRYARTSDMVCRTGGEELVVLCPGTDLKGAITLAEKLHAAVRDIQLPPVPRITASFGVVTARSDDQLPSLMKRADDLVYAAKRAGRDQVMHWVEDTAPLQ